MTRLRRGFGGTRSLEGSPDFLSRGLGELELAKW